MCYFMNICIQYMYTIDAMYTVYVHNYVYNIRIQCIYIYIYNMQLCSICVQYCSKHAVDFPMRET